jgi:hypothetical protein
MTGPDYVVIRATADLPVGFLPEYIEGRWFDVSTWVPDRRSVALGMGVGVAVPTGRFEVRDDGAVAEVYEVRP